MTDKIKVTLISSYPKLKMLTPLGKLEFKDGVCEVAFDSKEKADSFVQQIKDNPALGAYVRVGDSAQAKVVANANVAAVNRSSVQQGVQTSEAKLPEGQTAKPSAATVFNLAAKKEG